MKPEQLLILQWSVKVILDQSHKAFRWSASGFLMPDELRRDKFQMKRLTTPMREPTAVRQAA